MAPGGDCVMLIRCPSRKSSGRPGSTSRVFLDCSTMMSSSWEVILAIWMLAMICSHPAIMMWKLPCLAWAENMHPLQRHCIQFLMPMGCLPAPTSAEYWHAGTLGIFLASTLARKGKKVAVVERGKLRGRTQEWNISRHDMKVCCLHSPWLPNRAVLGPTYDRGLEDPVLRA
jgi:hypothetical protein